MGDNNIRLLLRQYLLEFWWRRWTILLVAWVVCVAGWLYVISLPDRYTATAKVYIDTQTILNPLMRGLAVRPDIDQQVDMMRRTLLTRPNIEELMRMTDLDLQVSTPAQTESMVAALRRRIELGSESRQIMAMAFEDENPELAQRVVQGLLSIFVEQNVGNNRRDIENTRRFIDVQIAEYEKRLREAEATVSEFRHTHAEELQAKDGAVRELARLESEQRQLDAEIQAAVWQRDQLSADLARTPEFLTGVEALMARRLPTAQHLADLEAQLNALRLRVTDRHPDVQALRRQIRNTRADLDREAKASGLPADGRIDNPAHQRIGEEVRRIDFSIGMLRQRVERNNQSMADLRRRVDEVPAVELQLAQMNRDYDILRNNYNQLTERRESAHLAQQLDDKTNNVEFRVVDPPVLPNRPTGPNRLMLLIGVLVAGFAAGLGMAFARIQLQDSFMSVAKLRDSFDVPVLGSITRVRSVIKGRRSRAVEVPGLVAGLGGLLVVFGTLLYLFHFSADKPDLSHLASRLYAQIQTTIGS
jgi:polysaccharide chain length determinant protein (PEP-CTERM system associated)